MRDRVRISNYLKTLDGKKTRLKELAGAEADVAFYRVRTIVQRTGATWLNAYDTVIHEYELAQKESK